MKKVLFLCLFTFMLNATEINNSLNNNHNSVITIVKEALGKDGQAYIVKQLAYEIDAHFSTVNKKLLDNKQVIKSLSSTIKESVKTNQSLTLLLVEREKQRAIDLLEIEKLKKEQVKSNDIDFKKVIEEAEEALKNYDSIEYQKILATYRENKKHKELIKNISVVANFQILKMKHVKDEF